MAEATYYISASADDGYCSGLVFTGTTALFVNPPSIGSFLNFDTSGLPADTVINSAYLSVYLDEEADYTIVADKTSSAPLNPTDDDQILTPDNPTTASSTGSADGGGGSRVDIDVTAIVAELVAEYDYNGTSSMLFFVNGTNSFQFMAMDHPTEDWHPQLKINHTPLDSVATDLAKPVGVRRRLFLKIDGFEPIIWQYADEAPPSGSRSNIVCLRPPKEFSTGLDLGSMKIDLSAMTFVLDDIPDTTDPSLSHFGKLFAPARWDVSNHWRIKEGDDYHQIINVNADIIPLRDGTDFPSSGTMYVGQETINYTGIDEGENFNVTGVTKGLHPCVGSSEYGYTYPRPEEGGAGFMQHIGEVPFGFHGRRVALYITTWATQNGTWQGIDNALLLWTGRISDTIKYDPRDAAWKLSCTSIVDDLEKRICMNLPEAELRLINLNTNVTEHRQLYINIVDDDGSPAYMTLTVDKGFYENWELCHELTQQFSEKFYALIKNNYAGSFSFVLNNEELAMSAWGSAFKVVVHGPLWTTLGFDDQSGSYEVGDFAEGNPATRVAYTPNIAYHPISSDLNGGKMALDDIYKLWGDQGDDSTESGAYIKVKKKRKSFNANNDREDLVYYKYTDRDDNMLDIKPASEMLITSDGYVAQKIDEEPIVVQQVYMPCYLKSDGTRQGVYETLLYPLLSTGTQNKFNHTTYDVMPLDLSLGVHNSLVNVDSFLNADASMSYEPSALRDGYIIDKAISWYDLLLREAKLYGKTLTWRSGQLHIVDVLLPDTSKRTLTIDDSVRGHSDQMSEIDMPSSTIVNQYECKIDYNPFEGKYKNPIIVTDVDSVTGSYVTKAVKIEHPGLPRGPGATPLRDMVDRLLRGRILRYPSPIIKTSVAPTTLRKIYVGEIVRFRSSHVPDPLGTGLMTTDVRALVLNSEWDYSTYQGTVTLMLLSKYSTYANPMVPAAMIDINELSAGWNAQTLTFALLENWFGLDGDPEDGTAFQAGDMIVIGEAAPRYTALGQTFVSNPVMVNAAYEDAGSKLLTIDTNITSVLNSAKQYFITFANYAACPSNQVNRGTWQANSRTELLNSAVSRAQRF